MDSDAEKFPEEPRQHIFHTPWDFYGGNKHVKFSMGFEVKYSMDFPCK